MTGHVKKLCLQIDGARLDCVRFGTGGRALVMLPGLTLRGVRESAYPLAWMYRSFSKYYTVYVLDKRAAIPSGYTIRDMARDAAQAMGQLGLPQADVLGVSQGGMIAQELAIRHPGLVRRLVLAVTASRPNGAMEGAVSGWIDKAGQGRWAAMAASMLEQMYSPAYIKKYRLLLPLLSRLGKPRDAGRFIALARACLTCASYPELHKITCPVLVIGARGDQVVTGRASEEMAERLPCELYMYEGLGHAAYDEARDFNQRVLAFLRAGG